MKNIKKLTLKKEVVSILARNEMHQEKGGVDTATCSDWFCQPTVGINTCFDTCDKTCPPSCMGTCYGGTCDGIGTCMESCQGTCYNSCDETCAISCGFTCGTLYWTCNQATCWQSCVGGGLQC